MITNLAHTAFAVRDIDASIDFYRKLGIEEAFRLHREDGSLMLVYLHISGEQFIEIFPGGPAEPTSQPQSFMHICLGTDDIRAEVESLRSAGVTIDVEVKQGKDENLQAWITDPDGNKIELMQISPDSPQWKTAHSSSR